MAKVQRIVFSLLLVWLVMCSAGWAQTGRPLVTGQPAGGDLGGTYPNPAVESIQSGDSFPVSPAVNDLFIVTNDSTVGACDANEGLSISLCLWDGTAWVSVGGSATSTPTWDQTVTQGREVTSANTENPLKIGKSASDPDINKLCLSSDTSTGEPQIRPCAAQDVFRICEANFNCGFYDKENESEIETIDPDAASSFAMYTYASGYRPLDSLVFSPASFSMQGVASRVEEAVVSGGGLIQDAIIVTDADTDGFHVALGAPRGWSGEPLFVRMWAICAEAACAGVLDIDFSAECVQDSGAVATTISTTGEQQVALTFDTQNDAETAENATGIMVNGTCTTPAVLRLQGQVDATATTLSAAELADTRIISIAVRYPRASRSD